MDNIILNYLNRYKIQTGLAINDIFEIENQLISFLKQKPDIKNFRLDLFNILFKLKTSLDRLVILQKHDKYYESMSILLSYFIELEILSFNDLKCDKSNLNVFKRILDYLNYFLNSDKSWIVRTFVHYFIRDNNIVNLKDDKIVKDLFCMMFEKLFLSDIDRKKQIISDELDFFSYLFIFKIWHYVSNTEEKHKIERLIPLLYNFDSNLSLFVISKKSKTDTYYDNGSYTIMFIKDRIIKLLKTDENTEKSTKRIENFTKVSIDDYKVQINWLDKLSNNQNILEDSDVSPIQPMTSKLSDTATIRTDSPDMLRNFSNVDFLAQNSNPITLKVSDTTTVRVDSPDMLKNFSEADFLVQDSNQIIPKLSNTTTVRIASPDMSDNFSDVGALLLPADLLSSDHSSLYTVDTEHTRSNVSSTTDTYVTCQSSLENIDITNNVIMRPKSLSLPGFETHPHYSNEKSQIGIIERKDYIKRGNSFKNSFSMLRNKLLVTNKNTTKRKSLEMDDGWVTIKHCSPRIRKFDNLEIEAFLNKKLPLAYFLRLNKIKSSINDDSMNLDKSDINTKNCSKKAKYRNKSM